MYAQIMIDCQTKTVLLSCEYCIANRTCPFHKNMDQIDILSCLKAGDSCSGTSLHFSFPLLPHSLNSESVSRKILFIQVLASPTKTYSCSLTGAEALISTSDFLPLAPCGFGEGRFGVAPPYQCDAFKHFQLQTTNQQYAKGTLKVYAIHLLTKVRSFLADFSCKEEISLLKGAL